MGDYLIQRGKNWFVRVAVPRPLWGAVGRREIQRTTGTADRKVAEKLRHGIIADIHREIELAVDNDPASPSWLERQAIALRRAVQRGELDGEVASYLISDLKDHHLKAVGNPEEAAFHLPQQIERVQRATRIVNDLSYKPISQVIEGYIEERTPSVNASTVGAMERALGAFQKWLPGDPAVSEITRYETGQYVSDVLVKNGKSPKTNRDTLSFLSAFWRWCIRRGLYEKANPWEGLRVDLAGSKRGKGTQGRRPWTPAEIGKLDLLPVDDPMYPMCMIALYSGMRLNEIAELRVQDVDLKAGMFIIREGKTKASVRQVPIHQAIAEMVKSWHEEATDGYLIGGLKPGGVDKRRGHSIAKRIGRWIRENVSTDQGVVFHSLRNTFMHQCERVGIPESTVQLIVGHARQSLTFGLYSNNPGFDILVAAVQKITYEEA